jgi:hypothetical protein
MPEIHFERTLKSVRESLCVAQTAIGWADHMAESTRRAHIDKIGELIADIDRQRPLASNGKHDNLHTRTCGCEDVRRPGRLKTILSRLVGLGRGSDA